MSKISSVSTSLNAVPSECEVYLDRRMIPGEAEDDIRQEMEQFIKGKNVTWEVRTLHRKSWTGMEIKYEPLHLAWKIDLSHDLTEAHMQNENRMVNQVLDACSFYTRVINRI